MAVEAITKALGNVYDVVTAITAHSLPVLQDYAGKLQVMSKELAEAQTPTLEELQGRVSTTADTLLELSTQATTTAVGFFLHVQGQYWARVSDAMIEDPHVVLAQLDGDWQDIQHLVKIECKEQDEWVELDFSFSQIFVNLGINDPQTQALLTELISQKKGWEFLDETTQHGGKVLAQSIKAHMVFSLATLLFQENLETFCKHVQNFPLSDVMVRDFAFTLFETKPPFLCLFLENFLSGHPDLRDVFAHKIQEEDIYLFCNYLPKFGYQTEEEYSALALDVAAREPVALCELFHHFIINDSEKVLTIVHRLADCCFNTLARNFSKFVKRQAPRSAHCVVLLSLEQRWAVVTRYREEHAQDICTHIGQFHLSGNDEFYDLAMYLIAKAPAMLAQKMAHFQMGQGQYKAVVNSLIKPNSFLLLNCLHLIPIEDEAFLYKVADYLARIHPVEFYKKFVVNFRKMMSIHDFDAAFEYRLSREHRDELAYVVSCLILEQGIGGIADGDVYDAFGFPGRGMAEKLLNEPLATLLYTEDPTKRVAEWVEDSGDVEDAKKDT